jgi:hypothetical protein
MNEVVKINPELQEVIQNSNVSDLTKAEQIALNYSPLFEQITEQSNILKGLEKGNKEHLAQAKRIRIDLGKIASAAEKQKKNDKDQILLEGRFIDALFNTVNGAARLTQNEAKEIEDYFEVQEQLRLEKLKAERWEQIRVFTNDVQPIGIEAMSDDVFEAFKNGLESQYNLKIEAEKQAEEKRIAEQKAEAERLEAQRLENERLKRDAEIKERERQAEAKKQAEILAKQKAEADKKLKAEREAREKIEAEAEKKRQAAEVLLKKEREAKAKIEAELEAKRQAEIKAEADRVAKEKAEQLAKKKAEKAPIKTKLNVAIDTLNLELPDSEITHDILVKFNGFKKWAKEQIEAL